MNPFGRAGAYVALFSEIGILLLVTTLMGVGAGYWLDKRLGTLPAFVVVGFLLGATAGAVGIYRLVSRFLKALDAEDRARASDGMAGPNGGAEGAHERSGNRSERERG